MRVSVCMIVRNEEALLATAVESTRGLADEVVIVDTGSEDGTVALARELGAVVVEGADRMHKGAARNLGLDAAAGDWVVVLDADERIADAAGVRGFLEGSDAQAAYIRLAYVNDAGQPTLSYQQMRCWRRGTYRYKYRAHEVPVPVDGWGELAHTEFVWEHRPPRDRTWKKEYTLRRLLMDVEENPGDTRPLYYLGRQQMYNSNYREAITVLRQYLDTPGKRDRADAWHCLAKCYGALGDKPEQIKALHQACAEYPMRRDWWGSLAELYHADGQDTLAAGLLKLALEIPMPAGSYTSHHWYGAHIHDLLARCLWKLKRYDEGCEHAKRAVELQPGDSRLQKNLSFFTDVVESRIENPIRAPTRHTGKAVLFLARRDYANVGYRMMQAINQLDGWCAHAVTCGAEYFHYQKDIFMPSKEEVDRLCRWADVIHIFDSWPRDVIKYGKPVFVSYNGKYYRDNYGVLAKDEAENGITQLCTTIDLTRYGATWMPVPMCVNGVKPVQRDGVNFVVAHAPTRRDVKGTRFVEALQELDGVQVDLIEGVSNAECLNRKASADLYVDQFELGYGVNALEAWALGVPVVAGAKRDIAALIEEHIGYLPFVCCRPEELAGQVEQLRVDGRIYVEACDRGMAYVRDFHDPVKVARRLVELYEGG